MVGATLYVKHILVPQTSTSAHLETSPALLLIYKYKY